MIVIVINILYVNVMIVIMINMLMWWLLLLLTYYMLMWWMWLGLHWQWQLMSLTRSLLLEGPELPLAGVLKAEEVEDQLETRTANVSVFAFDN